MPTEMTVGNNASSVPSAAEATPPLQAVHYANVVAYVVNVGITYFMATPASSLPSNGELSQKYQTLVTPAGYAFSIWGLIFLSQLVWTVLQLRPQNRNSDWVLKGVGYWYVLVCAAQAIWSVVFALEWIVLSLVAMLTILVGLLVICIQFSFWDALTVDVTSAQQQRRDFWSFQFPFYVHCGWIMAASLININVVLVAAGRSAAGQTSLAWMSLTCLAGIAYYFLVKKDSPVIPLVLAWACVGIFVELLPSQIEDSIAETFSTSTIIQIQIVSLGLALLILGKSLYTAYLHYSASQSPSIPATEDHESQPSRYEAMD